MMTVLVANNTPPAVRGMLKRWFVEPRANVFVGTINVRVRQKVLEYLRPHAPQMGLLMLAGDNSIQQFCMQQWGEPDRCAVSLSGLHLVRENPAAPQMAESTTGMPAQQTPADNRAPVRTSPLYPAYYDQVDPDETPPIGATGLQGSLNDNPAE